MIESMNYILGTTKFNNLKFITVKTKEEDNGNYIAVINYML